MTVRHISQVISTMSPLEGVKCLSMEDVVEMTTGLVPLKNVPEHVGIVSIIMPSQKFNHLLLCSC